MTEAEKFIPILFYGWVVPGTRRAAILNELQVKHGITITLSNMQTYGCAARVSLCICRPSQHADSVSLALTGLPMMRVYVSTCATMPVQIVWGGAALGLPCAWTKVLVAERDLHEMPL